jgi:hypothetical protein
MANHGKRRKPYRVLWGGDEPYTTNATEFARALASGWIAAVTDRVAKIADGVCARLEDGVLALYEAARPNVFLMTFSMLIERKCPVIKGEYYQREIQREYGGPSVKLRDSGLPWYKRCPGPIPKAA